MDITALSFAFRDAMRTAFPWGNVLRFHADLDYVQTTRLTQYLDYRVHCSPLLAAIDTLLDAVYFETEEETIQPENVEKVKDAFRTFLKDANLTLSAPAFEDILKENTGIYEFRGDGKTPNWYHFFRQVLPKLSFIKAGLIDEETLDHHGGLDVLIASVLYHDSWEDQGKEPMLIFKSLTRHVEALHNEHQIDDLTHFNLQHKAAAVAQIVDCCSHQQPVRNTESGALIYNNNGKLKRVRRFGGDLNTYYNRQLQHPFVPWIKWDDASEGTSTRILEDSLERSGKSKFSVVSNSQYAGKIRGFYGRRANDAIAIEKWPEFENVYRCADDMLGINLVMLETFNDYAWEKELLPQNAVPAKMDQYSSAWKGYAFVPAGWRSDRIQTDRIDKIAQHDERYEHLLNRVLYPSLGMFSCDIEFDEDINTGLNPHPASGLIL